MKQHTHRIPALAAAAVLGLSVLAAPVSAAAAAPAEENGVLDLLPDGVREFLGLGEGPLRIAEQGIFSAGGTVIRSDGTFDVSSYYTSREGSTSHVDHANVLYQIPENDIELPMVFLHGYGQSRMGWMTTPAGARRARPRWPAPSQPSRPTRPGTPSSASAPIGTISSPTTRGRSSPAGRRRWTSSSAR